MCIAINFLVNRNGRTPFMIFHCIDDFEMQKCSCCFLKFSHCCQKCSFSYDSWQRTTKSLISKTLFSFCCLLPLGRLLPLNGTLLLRRVAHLKMAGVPICTFFTTDGCTIYLRFHNFHMSLIFSRDNIRGKLLTTDHGTFRKNRFYEHIYRMHSVDLWRHPELNPSPPARGPMP